MAGLTRDYSVAGVKRAFDALEALAGADGGLRAKDIAGRLAVSPNTAFRLLYTLEIAGYVEKDPRAKTYTLGLELFRLGNASQGPRGALRRAAGPVLQELHARFQETVNLGVLHRNGIMYVERLESPHSLRTTNEVGSIARLHTTSLGKAILAFLPPQELRSLLGRDPLTPATHFSIIDLGQLGRELGLVRKNGFSVDNEENIVGVRCIGAPIFGQDNAVTAALSVAAPVQRMTDPRILDEVQEAVAEAGRRVSRTLGCSGEPWHRA
jgi:IclR family KDG regulon transcriptional repressor